MGMKMFAVWLAFAAGVWAQPDCPQMRAQSTWQTTTLFDLTYACTPQGWEPFFNRADVKAEVRKISDKLALEVQAGNDVNPAIGDVFRAMYAVPRSGTRSVILGQDPAPTRGEATGLAFSLKPQTPSSKVPSVQRVMLEALNEGYSLNLGDGDLSTWASQGVLMLNTALTIPCANGAKSCKIGGHLTAWKKFSKALLTEIDLIEGPLTIILWGEKAAKVSIDLANPLHRVIMGGHPSPLAPGAKFFCQSYFKCANQWLADHQAPGIDWSTANGPGFSTPCVWSRGKIPKCLAVCTMAACEEPANPQANAAPVE